VSWLQSPAPGRDTPGWKLHPLYRAGWIMSLVPHDIDADGDDDVVVSDRRGKNRGIFCLENPGAAALARGDAARWIEHRLGGAENEVMFLDVADLDGDGKKDIVCATRDGEIIFLQRTGESISDWREYRIENPMGIPGGKSVRAADIDGDGRMDLIHTAELRASPGLPGVTWMSYREHATDRVWDARDISGLEGNKFDLVQTLDLDADGDLDILACEERDNLGVVWYENKVRVER
jgi:hypothetical protein